MNLEPNRNRWPFTLEKWYVDTITTDGVVLLVYLARIRALGLDVARATAELLLPDGTTRRGDGVARGLRGGEDWLAFGPVALEKNQLSFEMPGLSGHLTFAPRAPAFTLRDPFLRAGDRRLDWTVEVPDADVTGEVRWAGGRLPLTGRGYRDRVWFDLPLWSFPIRELRWGRAVAGPHAATWVEAGTRGGTVEAAWLDGRELDRRPAEVELGRPRVLVETNVADLEGLRLGPARPLLRRLSGNPREIKWFARAVIGDAAGVAVHEVVNWR